MEEVKSTEIVQEAPQAEDVVQESPEIQASTSEAKGEALEAKADSGAKLTKKEEKQLKEYRLKVNGREKTVAFDPSNDEEVVRYLQKAESADSKFAEAAEVRKAAMQFIEELKKNPKRVLSDPSIGVDLKKFAEDIMNEAIQEMEKSPEQREREKLQKELEDIKKQRDKEKKDWEQKELARLQEEHHRQIETEISAALDIGGLPKTPRTVKSMAEMMMIALEHNIDLSPREIAPIVKDMNVREFKEVVNSLADDQLEDFLGKEVIGRLRKRNVAKAKAAVETANAVKSTGTTSATAKKEESAIPKMSIRDFLKV